MESVLMIWNLRERYLDPIVTMDATWLFVICCYWIPSLFKLGGDIGPSFEIDNVQSSYYLCCGLEPWVNQYPPGSCSISLTLFTPRVDCRRAHMDIDPS